MPRIYLGSSCFWFLALIIFALLVELSRPAAAQLGFQGGGRRHRGSETQDRQGYDLQTVTTVKGEVESLGSYGLMGWRVAPGMRTQGLVLKTAQGNITVNLGPPWYVNQQDFHLKAGDSLEVTGSKVTKDDRTRLLAARVKKDGQILKVRDEKGAPLWREQERGGRGSGGLGPGGMGSGHRGFGGPGQINW